MKKAIVSSLVTILLINKVLRTNVVKKTIIDTVFKLAIKGTINLQKDTDVDQATNEDKIIPWSTSTWIMSKLLFNKQLSNFVPHLKYGSVVKWKHFPSLTLSKYSGTNFPDLRSRFSTEQAYLDQMKKQGFNFITPFPKQKTIVGVFEDFVSNNLGVDIMQFYVQNNTLYGVLDTSELRKYKKKKGYAELNTQAHFLFSNKTTTFHHCVVDGKTFTTNTPGHDFAIRQCMTALATLITIRKHLVECHILGADQLNVLIEKHLNKENPIRRLLSIITVRPYLSLERAVLSLLDKTGFAKMFNMTHTGFLAYIKYCIENFDIRDSLDFKHYFEQEVPHRHRSTLKKCVPICNHSLKWYDIIHEFTTSFVAHTYPTKIINKDTKIFLNKLCHTYPGIFKNNKSLFDNLIDVCTIALFVNILHEMYSNPPTSQISTNPFYMSFIWKSNTSLKLHDHITNYSEQQKINYMAFTTNLSSKLLKSDFTNLTRSPEERTIFKQFQRNIEAFGRELDKTFPVKPILHPDNIECSLRW